MNATMTMKAVAILAAMAAGTAMAAEPAPKVSVTVDLKGEMGPIRLMNAVNNGPMVAPVRGDQKRGNFEEYRAARIPYARTHDSINCVSGGAHCCDIDAIFPDFDADENDPKNYDFVFTDHYLDSMVRAGTKPYFRLGQTIEHGPKKYGVLPPKDYAKWARICEHVIRHYNEGWGWGVDTARTTVNIAWSNQFDIVYWEIWNEPDLDPYDDIAKNVAPRCWGGTVTNFFEFYTTAARHLKKTFPNLKIGGPAICGRVNWGLRFLDWCRDNKVPLDFYSWHGYSRWPSHTQSLCRMWRTELDKRGFTKTESIFNEWNYVKGWGDDWVYSLRAESGDLNLKGAAFIAGVMIDCQNAPVDMIMFYDAKAMSGMNNIFDKTTMWPTKGYYPYLAWAKLLDLGTQVRCRVTEGLQEDVKAATGVVDESKKDKVVPGGFTAVAAKAKSGTGGAVFVCRYSDDDNASETGLLSVRVPGVDLAKAKARCHVTDLIRSNTEVPLLFQPDGSALVKMMPLSFTIVEW